MYKRFFKSLIDFIGAFLLLLLFSPVMVIASILIYLKLGSPVFFKQKRPGKDEKIFTIYKFRTMSDTKDSYGNFLEDEMRLNKFGKTLRSLSIDELPQLFNILKGDMSFIGPRPLLIEYLNLYNKQQKKRHNVKPGLTGWAQVNGRNNISWKKKFEYDLYYTENLSFWLDIKIVLLSIKKILKREGISSYRHATAEKFNGNN